jgi:hypothetical protein
MKGDYEEFYALKAAKNKANSSLSLQLRSGQALSSVEWSQTPGFGWESDNSGCVAGRLLPRVGRETRRVGRNFPVCHVLITSMLIGCIMAKTLLDIGAATNCPDLL